MIPRARAAASWGRVGPRDATASARATRNPAYAGPVFLAVYFVMNAMSWGKTEARFGISMKNWPRNKLWNRSKQEEKNLEVALRCPVQYSEMGFKRTFINNSKI